jgi:dTDP-4-dehydrorhamnose reductase
MKKILILGARGNLGQQLLKVFADFEVTAWDREEIDLGNREDLRQKILTLRPEIVINAAAYNNVDQAEEEPAAARLINGEAVGWLAEICKETGAVLVHYSTDYVFKGDKKEGYTEDAIPEPPSAYAQSKFLGEQKILEVKPKFYLIRTSRLFGPAGTGAGAKTSFV